MHARRHGRPGHLFDDRSARVGLRPALLRVRSSLRRAARAGAPDAQFRPRRAPATPARALAITRERHGSGVHLIVSGTLDVASAQRLRAECLRDWPDEIHVILLDMARVTSMDGSGLGELHAAYRHLGERLSIILGPTCAHVIHIAGARERLPIIEG